MCANNQTIAAITGIYNDDEKRKQDRKGTENYWAVMGTLTAVSIDDRYTPTFCDYIAELAEDIAIEEAKRGNMLPLIDQREREFADA